MNNLDRSSQKLGGLWLNAGGLSPETLTAVLSSDTCPALPVRRMNDFREKFKNA